jgi:glycopeptide antibiotics resistance protein
MRVKIAVTGLAICMIVVLLATLSPTPIDRGYRPVIERFLSVLRRSGAPEWFGYHWFEFFANVLMFIPVGFFLALMFATKFRWISLLLVSALSATLELAQFFFLPARFAAVDDVVANSLGGWVGVAAAALVVTLVHVRDRRVIDTWREHNLVAVRGPAQ